VISPEAIRSTLLWAGSEFCPFRWRDYDYLAEAVFGGNMDANEYQKLAARTLIDRPDFAVPEKEIMTVANTRRTGHTIGMPVS
jgi:hypothetical protein